MEAYISDINAIAKKKFHLLGHSWGGLYAQIYANKYPENILSLFLSSPGTETGSEWNQMEKEMMDYNKKHTTSWWWLKMGFYSFLGSLWISWASKALFREVDKNYNADFPEFKNEFNDIENVSVEAFHKTTKEVKKYPLLAIFKNPDIPVTITFGDNDIFSESMNFIKNRYPNAKIYIIKNSGHFPALHNPKDYFDILNQHFKV